MKSFIQLILVLGIVCATYAASFNVFLEDSQNNFFDRQKRQGTVSSDGSVSSGGDTPVSSVPGSSPGSPGVADGGSVGGSTGGGETVPPSGGEQLIPGGGGNGEVMPILAPTSGGIPSQIGGSGNRRPNSGSRGRGRGRGRQPNRRRRNRGRRPNNRNRRRGNRRGGNRQGTRLGRVGRLRLG